jgi:hypothetical protein
VSLTAGSQGFGGLCFHLPLTSVAVYNSVLVHPSGHCFICRGFFDGSTSGMSEFLGTTNFLGAIVAARRRR